MLLPHVNSYQNQHYLWVFNSHSCFISTMCPLNYSQLNESYNIPIVKVIRSSRGPPVYVASKIFILLLKFEDILNHTYIARINMLASFVVHFVSIFHLHVRSLYSLWLPPWQVTNYDKNVFFSYWFAFSSLGVSVVHWVTCSHVQVKLPPETKDSHAGFLLAGQGA